MVFLYQKYLKTKKMPILRATNKRIESANKEQTQNDL